MKNLPQIQATPFIYNQPDKPGETPVVPGREPEKELPTVPNRQIPAIDPEIDTPSKDPGRDTPMVEPQG